MLSIAHGTISVVYHIRIVIFKITGFPIIIIYRVRAVSFKMTSLTIVMIKLKSFLKRIINAYIAGR